MEKKNKKKNPKKGKKKGKKLPEGATEIIPNKLYLGSGRDACNPKELEKWKITHVCNCAKEWKPTPELVQGYLHVELEDVESESIYPHFSAVIDFIRLSDIVLIHCVMGRSR